MKKRSTKEKVKEKGIIFSADMARAILSGNKTQTRRVIKSFYNQIFLTDEELKTKAHFLDIYGLNECEFKNGVAEWSEQSAVDDNRVCKKSKPKYQVGDIVYVKESAYITPENWCDTQSEANFPNRVYVGYKSDMSGDSIRCAEDYNIKLTPSIFMPKKYARIFLKITNIKVERVQDISEADSIKEGIQKADNEEPPFYADFGTSSLGFRYTAKEVYKALWDKINGKKANCSWEDNPAVFVYEFELLKDYKVSQ